VSASVLIGLFLALGTALAGIVGFLLKHRGAVTAPEVDFRRPLHSSIVLFAAPAYTAGVLVAMGGWGFHVAALALAPISLVQCVIAGGLVLLTPLADRVFDQSVTRREWTGVALTALGLAVLAATIEGAAKSSHDDYHAATLVLYLGVCCALAAATCFFASRTLRPGLTLALSAGLMWGASDISIKALSGRLDDGAAAVLIHPLAFAILALSLVGLLVSARSLQIGPAVPVIALTSAAGNVVTILAGPVVFGEPMPGDALGVVLRVAAFALVVGAAALTPPPALRTA
jgi:multidrug transporter EmrE-like cation transporter